LAQLEAHHNAGVQPLDQINTRNVERLQLPGRGRWKTRASGDKPLVYDGLCTANPRGVIQALDAATGDLLWEYRPEREKVSEGAGGDGNGVQRNIAIYEDKIFGTTNDPISSPWTPVRQADVGHRGGRSKTGVPIHFRPNRRSRQVIAV